jgi:hypothetical protein
MKLVCSCCGLPWATIQNGVLVVVARHGGDKHTNVLRLDDLYELMRRDTRPTEPREALTPER